MTRMKSWSSCFCVIQSYRALCADSQLYGTLPAEMKEQADEVSSMSVFLIFPVAEILLRATRDSGDGSHLVTKWYFNARASSSTRRFLYSPWLIGGEEGAIGYHAVASEDRGASEGIPVPGWQWSFHRRYCGGNVSPSAVRACVWRGGAKEQSKHVCVDRQTVQIGEDEDAFWWVARVYGGVRRDDAAG